MKTIDLTPTWPAAARIIMLALEHGNEDGKRNARIELMHMAEVAQMYVDSQKKELRKKIKSAHGS